MKHTLSILVQNQAGVLSRVAALFTRRGYNIESIAVGTTEDPRISRMTIVVEGDRREVEQITKNVHKLIEVLKVSDLTYDDMVARELALIKVTADSHNRSEIMQICDIFRAKIINVAHESLIIEITGDETKLNAFLKLLDSFGILELARTGQLALIR